MNNIREFAVVTVDGDCVFRIVWIPEDVLEVLGRAQARVDVVFGGDGLGQHVQDPLVLPLVPVQLNRLQVTSTFLLLLAKTLWRTNGNILCDDMQN